MSKTELRDAIRARLRAADPDVLAAASERICRAIAALPAWREARLAAVFLPLAREPQIQALWKDAGGPVLCVPQVRGPEVMLRRVEDRALLTGADWKLDAPAFSRCPEVSPAELDAILVPGVAFTRDGQRLGRGGGYYDRLLAEGGPAIRRIGVCFECQLVEALPHEAHDQRVALVITERENGPRESRGLPV